MFQEIEQRAELKMAAVRELGMEVKPPLPANPNGPLQWINSRSGRRGEDYEASNSAAVELPGTAVDEP